MNCGFRMQIVGLAQPLDDPVNNGGHLHDYGSNHEFLPPHV